ncbi:hypothetical protein TNCV_531271 [Trichonephila clavipes]|nr:hypothetical protein TNCV_531271 [Trichonephila clavipes]
MLEKVIENWTSRLDYTRASRGSAMPEIIFKIYRYNLDFTRFFIYGTIDRLFKQTVEREVSVRASSVVKAVRMRTPQNVRQKMTLFAKEMNMRSLTRWILFAKLMENMGLQIESDTDSQDLCGKSIDLDNA